MRRFMLALAVAGALAACGRGSTSVSTEESPAAPTPPAMEAYAPADREEGQSRTSGGEAGRAQDADAAQGATQSQPGSTPTGPAPVLYLAYTYAKQFEIPSDRLASVMDRHVQACVAAGPRLCQLVGANRSGDPESAMQGYVSMRGEPMWLRTFMSGLESQVDQAGGRVTGDTTTTEDLTRQIVDTEARFRALSALRDRLETLLRSRPGRLADLLEVERELARVQGEIDAIQSSLAVMRTRVAMSELTMQYQSAPRSVGSDTFEPLRNAFANFLAIIVRGLAFIVSLIAILIPVALVVVPIVWGIIWWQRRRGGHLLGTKPATTTVDEGDNPE